MPGSPGVTAELAHIVREIADHSDIGVTMKIYAHASLDEKRAAPRTLDRRIG